MRTIKLLDIVSKIILSSLIFMPFDFYAKLALDVVREKQDTEAGLKDVALPDAASNQAATKYVQTQAHLQLPTMRQLIESNFGNQVVPYYNIVSTAIVREERLKKTHYAFYHAAPSSTAVLSDLYTQLYFNQHPNEKPADDDTFRFLRFQGEKKDMTSQEFLADAMSKNGLVDDSGKLAAYLLSVNLSLFGNVGSKTESTWYWFLNSGRSAPSEKLCKAILDNFGLSHKYVKEIMALDDLLSSKESTLLQIFIPKEIVDDLVYLAWIRGIPASGPIMDWIKNYQKKGKGIAPEHRKGLVHTGVSREALMEKFKNEREKNPLFKKFMEDLEAGKFSVYAFLTAYCNKPYDLPNMNETEGRILFTEEGLHNPSSGIKFYRYLTTPRDKLEQYTKKLNTLVNKLLQEGTTPATAQK